MYYKKRMLELDIEMCKDIMEIYKIFLKLGLVPFIFMIYSVLSEGFNQTNINVSQIIFTIEGISLFLLICEFIKYKFKLYKYKKLLKGEIE